MTLTTPAPALTLDSNLDSIYDEPARPVLRLARGRHRRVLQGHPWAYANETDKGGKSLDLPPGALVRLACADGKFLGVASYNPHTLICARLLDHDPERIIDAAFFIERIEQAARLRQRWFSTPHYRLVHAEADGVPGLIIDRYGDVIVAQCNTAGMDAHGDRIVEALDRALRPKAIIFANDSASRTLEGLPLCKPSLVHGTASEAALVIENEAEFLCDPMEGQKTGWFYDQRQSRLAVAALAKGKRVLDLYAYRGGFAIQAARAGASQATLVERSERALDGARENAERNNVTTICRFERAETFAALSAFAAEGEQYDIVICDPPAFAKSRREVPQAQKGYEKLARLAAAVTAKNGLLFIASCSHAVSEACFFESVARGVRRAGRTGRLVWRKGAGPDHPIHLFLPESAYLKSLLLSLDL